MSTETPASDAEVLSQIPEGCPGGQAKSKRALLLALLCKYAPQQADKNRRFSGKESGQGCLAAQVGVSGFTMDPSACAECVRLTIKPHSNVQVALHIITALIEKLPRDLPIYARYVLSMIETVLRSNDVSLVENSIEPFETFCRNQDLANIATEQGLAHKYREVVRTYASFADPSSASYLPAKTSPPLAIRWRTAGLRAIKGVVSSESLASDGGASLKIILPVILENLYSPDEDILVPLKARLRESEKPEHDLARNRRMSVNTVSTVDTANGDPALAGQSAADNDRQAEMDARLLALRCLEQIVVSGSNKGQIRNATTIILQFISKKQFPRTTTRDSIANQDGNWATTLIELIATWCPVQVRFVILVTAMDTLHDTTPKEDALDSAYTILSVIDWLLKSSVNMIGLSVMDVLFGLMHYVTEILSPHDLAENPEKETKQDAQAEGAVFLSGRRKSLLALVEQSIGSLATHIYYGDQVADMMRAILRQFKAAPTSGNTTQSSLATVDETGATLLDQNNTQTESNGEKAHGESFAHAAVKLTALRAIKAILVVANLKASSIAAETETRNQVGIHVWEGTQGLLRDPERDVRHAYADAFLSWLQLETSKHDLKARVDPPKYVKQTSKRDSDELNKPNRRSTSAPGNQKELITLTAQSNFLRLLHLAIFDFALEAATIESEVLLLHLLLASLVEHLGVNAAQFGLPMVLKLQDDLFTSVDLGSVRARINIGSLVHGYLLALAEKFNIESTHAGVEIRNEIEKRQSKGQWLSKIKLPPTGLDRIECDEKVANDDEDSSIALTPFRNLDGLFKGIDESYRQSISSSPQSPPSVPVRGFIFPILNHNAAAQSQEENGLPSSVKEQMLSSWSREACLAAVEKESARTVSISGSRVGTMTRNSQVNGLGNGSASLHNGRMSIPEISRDVSRTPEPGSHKSPVRVTQLRRVLSVNNESQSRRENAVNGADASSVSIVSSGSDSMVSGAYSVSDVDGDGTSLQGREPQRTPEDDGMETPRASASAIALSGNNDASKGAQSSLGRVNSEEIPPVPPIPANLSIPGGFPNDSQRSLVADRPSTAPDASQQTSTKGRPESRPINTLGRYKTRSSNSLAAGISDVFKGQQINGTDSALDSNQKDQLRRLLDGFLSPDGSMLANGDRPITALPGSKSDLSGSYSGRRHSGGIGRPPY